MTTEIRWAGYEVWDALTELSQLADVEFQVLEVPDAIQLNNDPEAVAAAASVGVAVIRLGPPAIAAVRDLIAKYMDGKRGTIKIRAADTEINYEGPLSEKQRIHLLTALQKVAAQLEQQKASADSGPPEGPNEAKS